jgi:hypothetical protein
MTTRTVRCRCKNKDRHFGVCKCHKHKGDTVSEFTLPGFTTEETEVLASFGPDVASGWITSAEAEQIVRAARTDVWWCAQCDREWTVPSLPHNPICPRCGTSGWWRRFVS